VSVDDLEKYLVEIPESQYPLIVENCTFPFVPNFSEMIETIKNQGKSDEFMKYK